MQGTFEEWIQLECKIINERMPERINDSGNIRADLQVITFMYVPD
jgi:hypothetical protein